MCDFGMEGIILKLFDETNILTDEEGALVAIESLSYIQLIVALEDKFDIIFPDELLNFSTLRNVEDFVIVVGNLIEGGSIESEDAHYENC